MDEQNQTPPVTQPAKQKSIGPVIGTVIIVIVLIIGALYFWGAKLNRDASPQELEETMQPLSTSDSVDAIGADLSATAIDSIESELNSLETELGL